MTSQAMRLSQSSKEPTVPKLRTWRVIVPPPRVSTGTSSARISAAGKGRVATAAVRAKRPPPSLATTRWESMPT